MGVDTFPDITGEGFAKRLGNETYIKQDYGIGATHELKRKSSQCSDTNERTPATGYSHHRSV